MNLKLTKPQGHFLFILLVALGISFLMAIGASIIDGGLTTALTGKWIWHWFVSFLIAFVSAWFVIPMARRIADKLTRST